VLTELLLRGPQAPGALKPRVARMGYHASPEQIEALLRELAAQRSPLVESCRSGRANAIVAGGICSAMAANCRIRRPPIRRNRALPLQPRLRWQVLRSRPNWLRA
jgi:uncharacterized protein YceH (UPF0502 family)